VKVEKVQKLQKVARFARKNREKACRTALSQKDRAAIDAHKVSVQRTDAQ
jgi:hypothetical protein